MKRYIGIIAALAGVSVIALSGCEGGDEEADIEMSEEMEEEGAINVETAFPVTKTIAQVGTYIGTVESGEKISVIPRVSGYVKEKLHSLGDFVNAGDVLFVIDDTNLQLEKKKAEADVKDANAALAKDKADNEATKFDVNETLNTLDTKTQENYNNIQKATRAEYEAQLDLYKACKSENIHKKEGDYLEYLIGKDRESIDNAKDFTNKLKDNKSIYDSIAGAADLNTAKQVAHDKAGIDPATIPATYNTTTKVAEYYLNQKTPYKNLDELTKAIGESEAAEKSAKNAKDSHEEANRTNDLAIVADEVAIQKEKGNITGAQQDLALKRKVAADYEIYTKAKIWAQQQAKLAAGDASVLSASVKLSKAQIDLEIAQSKLDNASVKSPVSGEIVECKIEDFGTCSDSAVAYTIIDTSRKKAVFYVTGDAKNNMVVGQKAVIEKNGTNYEATIDHVSDTPDEKKLLYKVTAILSEDDKSAFDSGTSIRLVTDIKKSVNALTVPISVVYYDEGRAFVYVAKNGVAVKTSIETGIDDKTDIEVLSGLSPDDQVIVNWSAQLQDNAEVNITKAAEKVTVTAPSADTETKPEPDTAAADETTTVEPEQKTSVYVEATSNVNIRKDPTTDSERLTTAKAGEKFLKAGEEAGGWTKIIYNDSEAYIKSDYVRECGE